jgi:hypothetical protein
MSRGKNHFLFPIQKVGAKTSEVKVLIQKKKAPDRTNSRCKSSHLVDGDLGKSQEQEGVRIIEQSYWRVKQRMKTRSCMALYREALQECRWGSRKMKGDSRNFPLKSGKWNYH